MTKAGTSTIPIQTAVSKFTTALVKHNVTLLKSAYPVMAVKNKSTDRSWYTRLEASDNLVTWLFPGMGSPGVSAAGLE